MTGNLSYKDDVAYSQVHGNLRRNQRRGGWGEGAWLRVFCFDPPRSSSNERYDHGGGGGG